MSTLFIDFETRSTVDIKKAGSDVYARHPSTEVLCMGYAFDDMPAKIWTFDTPSVELMPIIKHVGLDGGLVVAHNASFELAVWNFAFKRRCAMPTLDSKQVQCTLAMSYAMALPGALEDAAPAAGLTLQKDTSGHRIMMQLSKPRSVLQQGDHREEFYWWEPSDVPEKFEKLYAYCKQDVEVERALYNRLMKLSPNEQALWQLDRKINDRGVQIDIAAAKKAIELVKLEEKRLNEEMREVTKGAVATCSAVGQLTDWLKFKGVQDVKSVDKAALMDLLSRTDLGVDTRRVIELRQEAAKSSTKKLVAMLAGACGDGRVRGCFQYHGAGATGRFAGRRIQPQNFPRPKIKQNAIEEVFGVLEHVCS